MDYFDVFDDNKKGSVLKISLNRINWSIYNISVIAITFLRSHFKIYIFFALIHSLTVSDNSQNHIVTGVPHLDTPGRTTQGSLVTTCNCYKP